MNNYNKGMMILHNEINAYKVDCSQINGVKGVVAEMVVRVISGNDFVCRSAFKRTCKRHNCSQKEARQALRDLCLIRRNDSFTYGCGLHNYDFTMKTFDEWLSLGFRVNKGETSYIRNSDNNCLFTSIQVTRCKCK